MFFGFDFLNGDNSLGFTNLNDKLEGLSVSNSKFDKIYLTTDTQNTSSSDFTSNVDTVILTTFDDKTLEAGNIGSFGKRLRSMQLKRRENGRNEWTTLAGYTITDADHLNFSFADYFARGRNTEYEYCVTYVLDDGTELPYIMASTTSRFDGAVISDSAISYHVLLDPKITNTTRNRESKVVTTLNGKYPYIFWGSESNYDSSNFSGTIIKNDGCDSWDFDGSYRYREDMINWLTNGDAKILKMSDGREWMMAVDGNVDVDNSEHLDKVSISFNFTQIGDFDSSDDLSNNGLTAFDESKYSVFYSVSLVLENATSSNRRVAIKSGAEYRTVLSPAAGYDLGDVNVVMNGVSITDTVFNAKTGEIIIPVATNNITISVIAARIKAAQIELDCTELNLKKDNRKQLHLKYIPENVKVGSISWTSTNEKVAKVIDGAVQAVGPGSATITAELDGLKKKCIVNVVSLSDGIKLNKFREGASIIEQENGNDTYFIVAKHDYEPELNGSGLTLLVRKSNYEQRRWNNRNLNNYAECELDTWFNSTYYNLLSDDLKKAICNTNIQYTVGGSLISNGSDKIQDILQRKVFALSANELGMEHSYAYKEGSILATYEELLATGSSNDTAQWTRTPSVKADNKYSSAIAVVFTNKNYSAQSVECSSTSSMWTSFDPGVGIVGGIIPNPYDIYARPAFTVNGNVMVALSYGVEVTSITVPDVQKNLTMYLGNTYQLTPTFAPVDATYPVTSYASSNPFVASVDKNGLVEAKSVGETSITISIDNINLICSVTVKNH